MDEVRRMNRAISSAGAYSAHFLVYFPGITVSMFQMRKLRYIKTRNCVPFGRWSHPHLYSKFEVRLDCLRPSQSQPPSKRRTQGSYC